MKSQKKFVFSFLLFGAFTLVYLVQKQLQQNDNYLIISIKRKIYTQSKIKQHKTNLNQVIYVRGNVKLGSNEHKLYTILNSPPLKEVFFTIEAEKPSDIEYSIFYSQRKHILYVFWKGSSDLPLDFTIEFITKLFNYMKDHQINSYITISKEHTGRWDSSNDWFYEEGSKMANESGVKRIASVLSESEYANLSLLISHSKVSIKMGRKYAYKLFNDIEEAEDWIIKDRLKHSVNR